MPDDASAAALSSLLMKITATIGAGDFCGGDGGVTVKATTTVDGNPYNQNSLENATIVRQNGANELECHGNQQHLCASRQSFIRATSAAAACFDDTTII